MLKLNAGFSRKIGEPNYGSRGASVNVELEVESNLIGDPDALLGRIRHLFDLARRSVDQELASANNGGNAPSQHSGRGNGTNDRQPVRYATQSQQRAIRAICKRLNRDADQLAHQRFNVNGLDELTLQEASALIDELKANQAPVGNGGRR
ncbi:MAG: hypothetical protein ACE5GE_16040 [Phycisphaerae bacterium]